MVTWEKDSRRHALAQKGVQTVFPSIVKPMNGTKPWKVGGGKTVKEFETVGKLNAWLNNPNNLEKLKEEYPPKEYHVYVDKTPPSIIAKKKGGD